MMTRLAFPRRQVVLEGGCWQVGTVLDGRGQRLGADGGDEAQEKVGSGMLTVGLGTHRVR